MNDLRYTIHQCKSMQLYIKTPRHDRIEIGSKVRVKKKDNIFRKTNPVFSSIWSDDIHEVTSIDKTSFPVIYYVNNMNRGFYSFQLQLVADSMPLMNTTLSEKIDVVGIQHENSFLRNRKIIPSHHEISYIIKKNGETDTAKASDLLLYKKLFGKDILTYSSFFQKPENISYVI